MKSALTKIAILTLCVSLVGCSTNTQKQNTGIGIGTGAVVGGLAGSLIGGGTGKAVAIGVGIVAGALIGGYIGHSMDSSDHARMDSAMNNPTGSSSTWKNDKSGNTYSMTPTSKKMSYDGNTNCRRFQAVVSMTDGKQEMVKGVACRQADGTWKTVK